MIVAIDGLFEEEPAEGEEDWPIPDEPDNPEKEP